MTLKDAHKRATHTLDKACSENSHYMLLTGEINGTNLDMSQSMIASPVILSEMILAYMSESPEFAIAVLTAAQKYMSNVNEQEIN